MKQLFSVKVNGKVVEHFEAKWQAKATRDDIVREDKTNKACVTKGPDHYKVVRSTT